VLPSPTTKQFVNTEDFDVGSIVPSALQWLVENVSHGERILEFGSGKSSRELGEFFDVTSVEDNADYADYSYPVKYVIAPIENGTYSLSIVRSVLRDSYAVVILDGPPAWEWHKRFARLGFLKLIDSIVGDPVFVIDDVQRIGEFIVALRLGMLNRKLILFCWKEKACAVLMPTPSLTVFNWDFWVLYKMAWPNLKLELVQYLKLLLKK
jgi:hypothetical protein